MKIEVSLCRGKSVSAPIVDAVKALADHMQKIKDHPVTQSILKGEENAKKS